MLDKCGVVLFMSGWLARLLEAVSVWYLRTPQKCQLRPRFALCQQLRLAEGSRPDICALHDILLRLRHNHNLIAYGRTKADKTRQELGDQSLE
jgi:hypothetical protein